MGSISETSKWVDDIYRIQIYDPVSAGQDGIVNIQPEQLANRTRYLKNTLETEHTVDGEHLIDNSMIAANAGIEESKLNLDYPTQTLKNKYLTAKNSLEELKAKIAAMVGENGFFVDSLVGVLQLNWRYGEYLFDFEFFNDGLTMRDIRNIESRRAIALDDSVDCGNTEGMYPGMRLLLFDNTYSEEVEILAVLEDGRIRLTKDIEHTYDDEFTYLGYTNWQVATGLAVTLTGTWYYSRISNILEDSAFGTLLICRDRDNGTLKVEYRDVDDTGEWIEADLQRKLVHDRDSDKIYELYHVSGSRLQLRISGTDVSVFHMALFPTPFALLESSIRTPKVILPEEFSEAWQDMLVVESSPFLSAYRDYYVQTEYGLFTTDTDELVHVIGTRHITPQVITNKRGMPDPGEYYVRCRHQSDVSEWSAWSKPVRITLHAARRLFGFDDHPGFDDSVLDTVGFYPITFGFSGARLSEGFDSVKFTTKLED